MNDLLDKRFRSDLRAILCTGSTVLLGTGNILRGDDAFGPELINRLSDLPIRCIDAGTTPENQIGVVARCKPDNILIADAVHMEMIPGSCRILQSEEILLYTGLTTHDLSPAHFMSMLAERTGAVIRMLAVQPLHLRFGEPISPGVVKALDELERLFRESVNHCC